MIDVERNELNTKLKRMSEDLLVDLSSLRDNFGEKQLTD